MDIPTTDDVQAAAPRRNVLPAVTDEELRILTVALSKHIIDLGYASLDDDVTAEILLTSRLMDRIKGRGAR